MRQTKFNHQIIDYPPKGLTCGTFRENQGASIALENWDARGNHKSS